MSILPMNFKHACIKTLSAVEAHPERSNQHEFNGVTELKNMFGADRSELNVRFSILGENGFLNSSMTWYDARERSEKRSEYRLYFRSNSVMEQAKEGDNVLIGYDDANVLHCILIRSGSKGHNPGITSWSPI